MSLVGKQIETPGAIEKLLPPSPRSADRVGAGKIPRSGTGRRVPLADRQGGRTDRSVECRKPKGTPCGCGFCPSASATPKRSPAISLPLGFVPAKRAGAMSWPWPSGNRARSKRPSSRRGDVPWQYRARRNIATCSRRSTKCGARCQVRGDHKVYLILPVAFTDKFYRAMASRRKSLRNLPGQHAPKDGKPTVERTIPKRKRGR